MFRNLHSLLLLAALFFILPLAAQTPVKYSLDLSDVGHHEIHITAEFPALPPQTFVLNMPRSSPGRYAVHEFAKNVYEVKAFNKEGNELDISRTTPHQWEVGGHDGYVKVEYTLYGDRADGTYTGIDSRKVHMNMPATFMYGADLEKRPIQLHIDLSGHPDWSVATQLKPLGKDLFEASDYYYFYDSPTIVGDIDLRSWTVEDDNGSYTIEVAMDHDGTEKELDDYVEWVKDVVEAERDVFGAFPAFDHGRYTFLCAYNPEAAGDGMEHRNSTICSSTGNLESYADRLIGTIAHEFFHSWNVERLRPQSLEPFNFDDANMSGELWFAEGFTSYYTPLVLRRADISTEESYLQSISRTIAGVEGSPGHLYHSPIEMSYQAPFVDAASFNDPTNFSNIFISYYTYGAYLGLALDLNLRGEFGVTLDDYMAKLWVEYGNTEVPYAIPDLERVLGEVCGDAKFAHDFFEKHIYSGELPDMKALLAPFGVSMEYSEPGVSGLPRLQLSYTENGVALESDPDELHPFFQAGLMQGDVITEVNGISAVTREEWDAAISALSIGQKYNLQYTRQGKTHESSFTAIQDPSITLSLSDDATSGKKFDLRKAWLKLD